ncbi:transmembrane amino acid transporter protein [Fragilaria crotonensis]|nr:transmembrane amino acid transporter protein [Fragilaria crotonensis]
MNTNVSGKARSKAKANARTNTRNVDKSPFFAPSTPRVIAISTSVTETPGGSKHTRSISIKDTVKENKSSIVGATANLINAIVGSGIVGIPFAIQQAGLATGIILVCLCAFLTDKSLRLLVETAKHANAPSYETTMEAAFGKMGFLFVCINMFIMSYGAMLSYLMIVKDTLPFVLGVTDLGMRRALLFVIAISVMLPLSAQRDMANLAKTSRISVCLDICMVALVAYMAPIAESLQSHGGWWNILQSSTLRLDTVFVGLGVLSFAFVCQHSAFIIAGSLERPTQLRWSTVTFRALWLCAVLANICGVSGYIGFMETTQGNILNNLPKDGVLPSLARGLLGVTMLFVFPMELFVARHVCVVTFFQGRRAHEGDDATILNRRDRRISLTVALFILAMIPALLFENVGNVLSVTGAIGGSCLSYIGPGAVYLGVHGAEFVKLSQSFWKNMTCTKVSKSVTTTTTSKYTDHERQPLRSSENTSDVEQHTTATTATNTTPVDYPEDSYLIQCGKAILWYVLGMPIWYAVAQVGAKGFGAYNVDLMAKSPHPSRLGHVKQYHQQQHRHSQKNSIPSTSTTRPLVRTGSANDMTLYQNTSSAAVGPHISIILPPTKPLAGFPNPTSTTRKLSQKESQQQQQRQQQQQQPEEEEEEDDPQLTPRIMDFVVAVGFCLFGVVALCAGLLSIFVAETTRRR